MASLSGGFLRLRSIHWRDDMTSLSEGLPRLSSIAMVAASGVMTWHQWAEGFLDLSKRPGWMESKATWSWWAFKFWDVGVQLGLLAQEMLRMRGYFSSFQTRHVKATGQVLRYTTTRWLHPIMKLMMMINNDATVTWNIHGVYEMNYLNEKISDDGVKGDVYFHFVPIR